MLCKWKQAQLGAVPCCQALPQCRHALERQPGVVARAGDEQLGIEIAPYAGVPLPALSKLAPNENHGTRRGHKTGLIDPVTFFLFVNYGLDIGHQIFVRSPFAEEEAKIMVLLAEQAGAKLTVGGDSNPRAKAAEWLRDGGDEADFAGRSIGKAIFAGGLTAFVGNLD